MSTQTSNTRTIKTIFTPKKVFALLALCVLVAASLVWRSSSAQSIVQSYTSDKTLQKGMVVMIDPKNGSKVIPATQEDSKQAYGVVVDPSDSPVTLSDGSGNAGQVYVAAEGRYEVLVSDENGSVATGDYLTLSSTPGIAMKATAKQPIAVAKALESFTGSQNIVATSGNTHIGRIIGTVSVKQNPLAATTRSSIPEIIQRTTQSVTKKSVNPLRIYASLLVFMFSIVISGSMLYAGIKTGITAIGRNPLSKKDIRRSLIEVILSSVIVFIIGLFAVYLLLRI